LDKKKKKTNRKQRGKEDTIDVNSHLQPTMNLLLTAAFLGVVNW
jgi:hypothetical protein